MIHSANRSECLLNQVNHLPPSLSRKGRDRPRPAAKLTVRRNVIITSCRSLDLKVHSHSAEALDWNDSCSLPISNLNHCLFSPSPLYIFFPSATDVLHQVSRILSQLPYSSDLLPITLWTTMMAWRVILMTQRLLHPPPQAKTTQGSAVPEVSKSLYQKRLFFSGISFSACDQCRKAKVMPTHNHSSILM